MSSIIAARYATARAVRRIGFRTVNAVDWARRYLNGAALVIAFTKGYAALSAKIAPCGCGSNGWESCERCDYGEGRSDDEICSCHGGEA